MRFHAFPEYLTSANYLISLGLSLLLCLLELLTEVDQLGDQQRFRVWGVVLTQKNGGCSRSLLPLDGLSSHFESLLYATGCQILDMHSQVLPGGRHRWNCQFFLHLFEGSSV